MKIGEKCRVTHGKSAAREPMAPNATSVRKADSENIQKKQWLNGQNISSID